MFDKFPVALTFDVDGETLWLARDPGNAHKPVTLSLGRYGLVEGVPRILKLLEENQIKGTFFIPGKIVDEYSDLVKRIDIEGHEIGNHGYSHTHPHKFQTREVEADEYKKSNESIETLIGKKVIGYRSPAWEFSKNTMDIITEMNFLYSSNMMHTDSIHFLEMNGTTSNIVEIPIHWVLDDAAFWLYSISIVGKSMQPLQAVEDYWKTEFDCLLQEFMEGRKDRVFVLTCHPQVIGRPARMNVLRNIINHIKKHDNVEFCTCGEIANKFIEAQK